MLGISDVLNAIRLPDLLFNVLVYFGALRPLLQGKWLGFSWPTFNAFLGLFLLQAIPPSAKNTAFFIWTGRVLSTSFSSFFSTVADLRAVFLASF